AVSLILVTIDRIKEILDVLEREQREPDGSDSDLIADLEAMLDEIEAKPEPQAAQRAVGTLVEQVLERPLRPGEDSLDELERAFRETPVEMPDPRTLAAAGP